MKKQLIFIALFISTLAISQTGTIEGTLIDKDQNNEPLPFANVLIQGTTQGAQSDFDGNYIIENIPTGTYTLEFSFVGYETRVIENVVVENNKFTRLDVTMGQSAATLEQVVITVQTSREREEALLLAQQKAVTQTVAIGAQELSRKGVGDVATAVSKVTGISKQQGSGNIFVRGLGDRYNVTTLNGLPLPSNDPEKKNIDLSLFSTDIVEAINIDKTYNPKNYGDFAGANIDISSKDYRGSGFFEVGLSSGVNTITIGEQNFFLNEGPNVSGFYDTNFPEFPLNNYNFETSWDRETVAVPINSSLSLKAGESVELGESTKLSFFGVGSFSNNYSYKEGISRGGVTVNSVANADFDYVDYSYNTNTTLMGNVGLKHNKQRISYNALFLNTSSQQQKEFFGIIDVEDDAPNGGGFIQRAVFLRTNLISHQLLGDHEIGERFDLDWGASYNFIKSSEPDRRQNTVLPRSNNDPEGPKSFLLVSAASDNHRFFADLEEEEVAGNLAATYKFKKNDDEGFDGNVTVGYSGRMKDVNFNSIQFNFQVFFDQELQPNVDIRDVDSYFNQQNLNNGLYQIRTFRGTADIPTALDGQFYGGDQTIHAGFLNLEYAFSDKLTALVGVRAEQINQFIEWNTVIQGEGENELDTFEILPSLNIKYVLNEKQNLKFAASKTYTLPQYKERAPFLYQRVNQDYFGNPALQLSTDYNVDIKWEFFPESSEIFSVGAFGKLIQDPINSIVIQSASNDITWANTGDDATAFGAELEIRKTLFENETDQGEDTLTEKLTGGLNAAYMIHDQQLDGAKVLEEAGLSFIPTYANTGLTGASDLVANADVSYFKDFSADKNIQLTVTGNYFSDRIFALGNFGKGNIIEKGFATLDFIAKTQLNENITIGISAKNLLNPSIERFQEAVDGDVNPDVNNVQQTEVDVLAYKLGYDFKLSLGYKF
ncbi:MAG: TonB-dependent receptor [Flavobacteriaceae bacterium]|nr:TonB-dependent receptor [Flavobacteriaceae bacterium]